MIEPYVFYAISHLVEEIKYSEQRIDYNITELERVSQIINNTEKFALDSALQKWLSEIRHSLTFIRYLLDKIQKKMSDLPTYAIIIDWEEEKKDLEQVIAENITEIERVSKLIDKTEKSDVAEKSVLNPESQKLPSEKRISLILIADLLNNICFDLILIGNSVRLIQNIASVYGSTDLDAELKKIEDRLTSLLQEYGGKSVA